MQGVRDGFVAAYDALAGATGITIKNGWTSRRLAELIFPLDSKLGMGAKGANEKFKKDQTTQVHVEGNKITVKDLHEDPFLVKQRSKRGRLKSLVSRRYRQKERLLRQRKLER